MQRTYIWLVAVLMAGFMLTQPTFASKEGAPPGGHLKITEVFFVDGEPDTLLITGEHFDFGDGELFVTLGQVGELVIVASDATSIEVEIPALPGGDYLLSVFREGGQSQGDEYDLTIATAGSSEPNLDGCPCFDLEEVVGGGTSYNETPSCQVTVYPSYTRYFAYGYPLENGIQPRWGVRLYGGQSQHYCTKELETVEISINSSTAIQCVLILRAALDCD